MMLKYFGTDGIRGLDTLFTDELLGKIAGGIISLGFKKIALARDPRVSGAAIELLLAANLSEIGADVTLFGMLPTPALAYLTKSGGFDMGIMISASHNPPEYNGIKLFSKMGEKVSEDVEESVEHYIDNPPVLPEIKGKTEFKNGEEDYINYVLDTLKPDLSGLTVAIDTSNGATSIVAPQIFLRAGAIVYQYANSVTGKDINVGCGATNPNYIKEAVKESGATLAFSYDGDGDRVFCLANGKPLNGDHLMYVHAKAMKADEKLVKDTVVGTIMSNMGTEKAYENAGLTLLRAGVGDKLVFREMEKNGYNLGGEESGHIIFTDYLRTGDGIIASVLTAMLHVKQSIDTLDDIVEYPCVSDKIKCTPVQVERFRKSAEIPAFLDGMKDKFRTVVRPSGTEPIIRILAEGEIREEVEEAAKNIRRFIEERIGE